MGSVLHQAEGGARVARGVAVEIRVGESITLRNSDGTPILLTLESKSGQRSRVRIQAADDVQIERPAKKFGSAG